MGIGHELSMGGVGGEKKLPGHAETVLSVPALFLFFLFLHSFFVRKGKIGCGSITVSRGHRGSAPNLYVQVQR